MKRNFTIACIIGALLLVASAAGAITYKGDLETEESVAFPEQTAPPASPPAGQRKLYFKDDGGLYQLDSSGNENPVVHSGFKNAIINGDFRVWQRGTSFNDPNGNYTADRWIGFLGSGNTVTYSRQSFTAGQTDVPGDPQYFYRINKTAGTGAPPELRSKLPRVRDFAGQTFTLSYYAKADSTRDIFTRLDENFGSGGSAEVISTSVTCNLTTFWKKCTATYALADASGKTIGAGDHLKVHFGLSDNANGTVDIALVQLEKGSVATEFERRPEDVEERLAYRFYQCLGFGISGWFNSATAIEITGIFPVKMRAAPTASLVDTSISYSNKTTGFSGASSGSSIVSTQLDPEGFNYVHIGGFSGQAAGDAFQSRNGDFICFDSEL